MKPSTQNQEDLKLNTINEINDNKILFTNDIFKWMKYFYMQKNTIIITPLTKIEKLYNCTSKSILKDIMINLDEKIFDKIINDNEALHLIEKLNKILSNNKEIVAFDFSSDKLFKNFFSINKEILINQYIVETFMKLLNKFTKKNINVVLSGFDLIQEQYNMINIVILTNKLKKYIHWNNIEQLIILDKSHPLEILDKDKFKSWLELKTQTILTIQDIENYFNDKINMNSFLIDRALKNV